MANEEIVKIVNRVMKELRFIIKSLICEMAGANQAGPGWMGIDVFDSLTTGTKQEMDQRNTIS